MNMDRLWDFEIVANDNKRFRTSKALLWCRSEHFKKLFAESEVKHIDADMSSPLVESVLEYLAKSTASHEDIEALLEVGSKVSRARTKVPALINLVQWEMRGLMSTCEYILVQDIINLKNVFRWCAVGSRLLDYNLRDYCVWLMRINYSAIKDKKEFQELPGGDVGSVMYGAWPGDHYKNMRDQWKRKHGKKGKHRACSHRKLTVLSDRCLLQ